MAFEKVVRPGAVEVDAVRVVPVFIKIKYSEAGRLSLSGVEGPRHDGNAWGSCGQIELHLTPDSILAGSFARGWDREKFADLLKFWRRWHLNDMQAACEHQRALGWLYLASKKVPLYHWRLTSAAYNAVKDAEKAAKDALKAGVTFTPSKEKTRLARLPHDVTTPTSAAPGPEYKAAAPLWEGSTPAVEEKALGWLYPGEHPEGILTKPCPECGYKYGSAWLKEEVPLGVIAFFQSLPEADTAPAWV